jgi:hypothetical protein
VTVIVDEGSELFLRDSGTSDVEGPERDRVRPLFVIEHERLTRQCPKGERAFRNPHIAWQGPTGFVARRSREGGERETRRRIAQGLPGVGERLIVHIFVEQSDEYAIHVFGVLSVASLDDLLQHSGHLPQSALAIGQRQLPSPVVDLCRGVIKVVRVGANRRFPTSTQDPPCEPG